MLKKKEKKFIFLISNSILIKKINSQNTHKLLMSDFYNNEDDINQS